MVLNLTGTSRIIWQTQGSVDVTDRTLIHWHFGVNSKEHGGEYCDRVPRPGLPVIFIRGNPDKKGIKSTQYDELALEQIRVALDRAKVYSDGFWLRLEFLFYYDIPESVREAQTLQFKNQAPGVSGLH